MPLLPTTAARVGFSLVELLVVLGIIATMAGLVVSGLFRNKDANPLLAAEQVLGDAIRQCRHTARSSGSPVELHLTQRVVGGVVTGARLAGVGRVCLWSETFDRERDSNEDGTIDEDDLGFAPLPDPGQTANGVVLGRSGNGRLVSAQFPIPPQPLAPASTIVRGGRNDGFYLACSVQVPAVVGNGTIIPLVMVGDPGGSHALSQCGIALQGYKLSIQGPISELLVWDVVGWVYDHDGIEAAINASTDPVRGRAGADLLPTGVNDQAHPLAGGRWVDVGLLYDGRRMVLYLDGVRIAERHSGVPATLRTIPDTATPPDGKSHELLHIGTMSLTGPPASTVYAAAALDDVRLFRLGAGEISDLPGNVVLMRDGRADARLGFRILCQPDGRVEASRDDEAGDASPENDRVTNYDDLVPVDAANPTGPKVLHARNGESSQIVIGLTRTPGTLQAARLTITLDGRVSSQLLTQAPTTSGGTP